MLTFALLSKCIMMDKYQLFDLLAHDSSNNQAAIASMLTEVLNDYPYFQTAHLLYAQNCASKASINGQLLARAATHVTNREVLYKLLRDNQTELGSDDAAANVAAISLQEPPMPASDQTYETAISPETDIFITDSADNEIAAETIDAANLHIFDELTDDDQATIAIDPNKWQLTNELDNDDQATEAIPLAHLQQFDRIDSQDEATEIIPANLITAIPTIRDNEKNTEYLPPINADNTVQEPENLVSQENTSFEVADMDSHQLSDNTEGIAEQARQQVERELLQIANKEQLASDKTTPSSDSLDIAYLLEKEAREMIQQDVEKDLQALQINPELNPEAAQDIAESTHLIQSLRETVETYKKDKLSDKPARDLEKYNEPEPEPEAGIEPINNYLSNRGGGDYAKPTPKYIQDDEEEDDKDTVYFTQQHDEPIDRSLHNTESILSETMARVYARQGYIEKATQIYAQLMEKYPEKSAFYAEKIAQLQ
jgi:hypothetical protein